MLVQQIAPVADEEFAPLFAALELSRSKWLVGVGAPGRWAVRRHEVEGGDLDGLLGLLQRLVREEGGAPVIRSKRISVLRPGATAIGSIAR